MAKKGAEKLLKAAGFMLVGTLVPAGSVRAQEAVPATGSGELEEVVVTAQRRSERLEEVPLSVAVLGGPELQAQGVFDFDNLTAATTGVRISRTGVFTQPAIRGISTQTLGSGAENNVATYVDGFYQPDQLTLSGDLIGVGDVQILKGPQGALYGRNATGGAILINTLNPTDRFEGTAHIGYARYDDYRADALVNVPLADGIAFNVVGNYRSSDSYIRDLTGIYPGTGSVTDPPPYKRNRDVGFIKDWGVRTKLGVELSPAANLTFAYRHRFFADNRATAFFMTDFPVFGPDPGSGFGRNGYDYVSVSVPNTNDVKLDEGSLKGIFEVGTGTLTSYTAYTEQEAVFNADYDGSKIDFVQAGGIFRRQTFQQALDYAITVQDRLDLVVGAFYLDDDAPGTSDTVLQGTRLISVLNRLKTKSAAAFADGTYRVTDNLFLTLGGRYTTERKSFSSRFVCCGLDGVELFPGTRSKRFNNFSPRGVIRYELAPRTNVYASVSRGFKSGTYNSVGSTPVSVSTPPVDAETITAYEIGFKTAGRGFRLEAAAYYYDYKNLQLTRLFLTQAGIDQVLENAATAEIYGAELSGEWSPTEALNLNASVNYNHARYDSFPDGAASVPVGGFITSASQDFSGRRIPRAPDWTVSAGGDYTVPLATAGRLVASANFFYSSTYVPTTPSYDPATGAALFRQPAYEQVNAALTWHSPDDRFQLGGYVNNIFNQRYRIWYNATALGAWYVLSEPTVYGVRAGVNF